MSRRTEFQNAQTTTKEHNKYNNTPTLSAHTRVQQNVTRVFKTQTTNNKQCKTDLGGDENVPRLAALSLQLAQIEERIARAGDAVAQEKAALAQAVALRIVLEDSERAALAECVALSKAGTAASAGNKRKMKTASTTASNKENADANVRASPSSQKVASVGADAAAAAAAADVTAAVAAYAGPVRYSKSGAVVPASLGIVSVSAAEFAKVPAYQVGVN
jgi:hypothetical protein